ncbi:hypothetical protein RchiOBHm_Chr2g0142291 [Rosa chinensis]|uniref:Uncharacterized protein n=1 Tax=Rosa chinensis TaxID=74649 RepID=A0A2P6RXV1_ROSCH|nr:hypothetical protein RchiOBHm_Chr2g0142291 [Rosa chinensis]
MGRRLGQAHGDLKPIVIGNLLHETVNLTFGSGKRGGAGHGALHELGLDLHVDELLLKRVHGLRHLLEVSGVERGLEGFDDGFGGEFQLHDLVHQLLRVAHGGRIWGIFDFLGFWMFWFLIGESLRLSNQEKIEKEILIYANFTRTSTRRSFRIISPFFFFFLFSLFFLSFLHYLSQFFFLFFFYFDLYVDN